MSIGHIYAAKARAELFSEEPDLPEKARKAFADIATILQMHLYDSPPHIEVERFPQAPGAVGKWLDAKKARREHLEALLTKSGNLA